MRKAFLKNVREKLVEMRRQTLREISNDLKQGREGAKDEGMDTYDLASEERDRSASS
jgi:RNA polymerase-binding transcription factor DksA